VCVCSCVYRVCPRERSPVRTHTHTLTHVRTLTPPHAHSHIHPQQMVMCLKELSIRGDIRTPVEYITHLLGVYAVCVVCVCVCV